MKNFSMYWLSIYCIESSPLYWISMDKCLVYWLSIYCIESSPLYLISMKKIHGVLTFIGNSPLYLINEEILDVFAFNILY